MNIETIEFFCKVQTFLRHKYLKAIYYYDKKGIMLSNVLKLRR